MSHTPEPDGGAQPDGELSERLLARRVNVGVVDVGWVQRQYARTADWVAQRFAVLGDVSARYGTTDSPAAGSAAALLIAPGHIARTESETPTPQDDYTPAGVGLERTAEVTAPPTVEAGGGEVPTLQRKAAPPEKTALPEKSAPPVSKESPPQGLAAPPSLMPLAVESPRAADADAPQEARDDTATVSAAQPPASVAPQAFSPKQEATIQPKFSSERDQTAEGLNTYTATGLDEHRFPLAQETATRAPTIMRAARGAEVSALIQRAAAVDAAESRIVETTFDAPAAAFTPSAAPQVGVELSTAVHATVQRAATPAAEARTQPRPSVPEIPRGPSLPPAARMVWRKGVGGSAPPNGGPDAASGALPYATPVSSSPSGVNTQTLYRAEAPTHTLARSAAEGEGGAAPAPAWSDAGGVSLEQITEHVSRVILRRIAVERERRGVRRWL